MTDPRDELLRLDAQLCFALVTASRNILSFYRPILEPLGLTHPQYLVMLALWERSPRSLGDLSDDLALDSATASPLVKRLEAQGLVRRERRPDNERRLDITLTERGEALRADTRQCVSTVPRSVTYCSYGPGEGSVAGEGGVPDFSVSSSSGPLPAVCAASSKEPSAATTSPRAAACGS